MDDMLDFIYVILCRHNVYFMLAEILKGNIDSRAKLKIPCKIVVGGDILVEGNTCIKCNLHSNSRSIRIFNRLIMESQYQIFTFPLNMFVKCACPPRIILTPMIT